METTCKWVTVEDGDEWECTSCHEYWIIGDTERDPFQRGIVYCPFCGEKIQEFVYRMEA